jgi:hypothetical protein
MITSLVMCKASGIRVGLQTSASYIKTVRQRYRYSHVWPLAKGLVCIYGPISISRSGTSVCPSVSVLCYLRIVDCRLRNPVNGLLPCESSSNNTVPVLDTFIHHAHTHTHTHTCTVALEYSATSTEIRQSISCQKFNKSLDLAE